eukprot:8592006-Pyramimonas_sp.AAC.1
MNPNITSFYGSSCANNNGKDALNTPETLPPTAGIYRWYIAPLVGHAPVAPRGGGTAFAALPLPIRAVPAASAP